MFYSMTVELSFAVFTYRDRSMYIIVVIYDIYLPCFTKSGISFIRNYIQCQQKKYLCQTSYFNFKKM